MQTPPLRSRIATQSPEVLLAGRQLAETLVEAFDTAAGIHYLLSAGVEWVALGANFNVQVFAQSRASVDLVTARAGNFDFFVVRMDFRLHLNFLKQCMPPPGSPEFETNPLEHWHRILIQPCHKDRIGKDAG